MLSCIQKISCCTNPVKPVDVLFVGFPEIDEAVQEHLIRGRYAWDCVSPEHFSVYFKIRTIRGVVVLNGHALRPGNLNGTLKALDTQNISVICCNAPEEPDIPHLNLASVLDSLNWDELWGRIESSIKYYRHLRQFAPVTRQPSGSPVLAEDTAQQLEMAAHVQRNFLPSRLPHTDKVRWAAMFSPAQWVSGDIYDIARLDEEHIGFYLADAVGHSMPAALLTMFLKQATVMRQTINNDYYIFKPWEVVSTLNLRMAEQELKGCLFATCVYGLLNIHTLTLEYARAGHPYPILVRDGQLQPLCSRGGLLGVFAESTFEQQSIQLLKGDKLFIFSDGGEPLIGTPLENGELDYHKEFLDICRLPVEQMIDAYSRMAAEHPFKAGETDDVTAIGLEIL